MLRWTLAESAARQRAKQAGDSGTERPALAQDGPRKHQRPLPGGGASLPRKPSPVSIPAFSCDLYRLRYEFDLLFGGDVQGDVGETTLHLQPFVANLAGELVGIVVEGLMEDADNQKLPLGAGRLLCELLEEIDVALTARGLFEEFPHLVDDEQEPAGIGSGDPAQGCEGRSRPRAGRFAFGACSLIAFRIAASGSARRPITGMTMRPLPPRFLADLIRGPGTDQGACNILLLGLVADKRSEGQGETRFAAAIGAGPRECPLAGLCDLCGHLLENLRGGRREDVTLQGAAVGHVRIDTDRLLEAAAYANEIGKGFIRRPSYARWPYRDRGCDEAV